jgi:hypothetical protein
MPAARPSTAGILVSVVRHNALEQSRGVGLSGDLLAYAAYFPDKTCAAVGRTLMAHHPGDGQARAAGAGREMRDGATTAVVRW